MPKKSLGRGLSSLFESTYSIDDNQIAKINKINSLEGEAKNKPSIYSISIEKIIAGPFQPRKHFQEEEIKNLALSIQKQGILQPLIVRQKKDEEGLYEIIAGERRWRAAHLAGLKELPVIIKNIGNKEGLEIALIENIQRENLSPLEEADAYIKLIEELGYTQEALAEVVGKSRSHISNIIRLLYLPEKVKNLLQSEKISAGHARALVNQENAEILANMIIQKEFSVRQLEEYLRKTNKNPNAITERKNKKEVSIESKKSTETKNLEETLKDQIGLETELLLNEEGSGKIIIHIQTFEDLDNFFHKLLYKVDPIIVSGEQFEA